MTDLLRCAGVLAWRRSRSPRPRAPRAPTWSNWRRVMASRGWRAEKVSMAWPVAEGGAGGGILLHAGVGASLPLEGQDVISSVGVARVEPGGPMGSPFP